MMRGMRSAAAAALLVVAELVGAVELPDLDTECVAVGGESLRWADGADLDFGTDVRTAERVHGGPEIFRYARRGLGRSSG